LARDFAKLDGLMQKYVHPLYAFRERLKGYEVAAMKTAMEMIGKSAGPVRPPLTNTREQDMDALRKVMDAYQGML
jgi:5-dehydro-4-deoxyglucarate dehydratase